MDSVYCAVRSEFSYKARKDKDHLKRDIITNAYISIGDRGGTLVKVLCYKSESRWFDSRWCHLNFSLTCFFRSHYGPGVDSASNRNEFQDHFFGGKCGRSLRLTTLPPSCAVVMKSGNLKFLEHSEPLQACNRTDFPLLYIFLYISIPLVFKRFYKI